MTVTAIADHLHARSAGEGRWIAKCPGHDDGRPSLSIKEESGRVLIYCRAGCPTAVVLVAAGLSFKDLFVGPPPTTEQAAQFAQERIRRELQVQCERLERRAACDLVRKLHSVVDSVGWKLATTPDDATNEADALARLFHDAVERLRKAEAAVER